MDSSGRGARRCISALPKPSFKGGQGSFREDFLRFQQKIAWHGALNSLSQVLLKVTAPGVPDFYQGSEIWDFSMVDPDNRRPVDFRRRVQLLGEVRGGHSDHLPPLLKDMLLEWKDGRSNSFSPIGRWISAGPTPRSTWKATTSDEPADQSRLPVRVCPR